MSEHNEKPQPSVAALEALLFIHGEPMTIELIGKVLLYDVRQVEELLDGYRVSLEHDGRGLMVVTDGAKIQLVTKPSFAGIIEQFVKSELTEELSPASVETLAIVSYFGPISRSRIDYQRGVNSSFILRSLLIRGLIDRHPDPARQNSYLYRPSFELLRHLGLSRPEDLPDYAKYHDLLNRFEGDLAGGSGDSLPQAAEQESAAEPELTQEEQSSA